MFYKGIFQEVINVIIKQVKYHINILYLTYLSFLDL